MKGYKAFNKDMTCRGFQYEEGKTYEESKAECCESGFHFCENPLDVLKYYNLCESEFAEVEVLGEVHKRSKSNDTKAATTKIKIGAKIGLPGLIKASFEYLWEKCYTNKDENVQAASGNDSQLAASGDYSKLVASGDCSKLAASGYGSQLAASGNDSKLAASGYGSKVVMEGENSIGAAIGSDSIIKGKKGCWITLAEYTWQGDKHVCICVKSTQIDGETIKEDTWYKLENGEFVEVEQ